MTNHTSTAVATAFTPEQISSLVVQPASRLSIAMQTCTIITTSSEKLRIPIITADASGDWVEEGDEIPVTNAQSDELVITPSKLATLTVISNELADDSTPEAKQIVGDGIARDVASKIDAAFFGALASPAPSGLGALSGFSAVSAGASYTNTDPFSEALSKAETVGTTLTAFVTDPVTALALAKVKKATGSNEPLLGTDATAPTKRTILGLPLLVSPHVTAGVVWGIPQDRTYVVVRKQTELAVTSDAFFTSDRLGIRAITRVGFGFPHRAALVKITTTG